MAKRKTLPVLDVPRLAKDSLLATKAALAAHRAAAFPGVTYVKYRAILLHAVEGAPDAIRRQALDTLRKCRSEIETRSNLECFLLTEELYGDVRSRCWSLGASQHEDQTGLVLRMPSAVVRYDVEGGYSAVVFPQPRKTFRPTEEDLAVLAVLLKRIWVPDARDLLFAPYPDMPFVVEFVDLACQRSGGPRVPRLRRLSDLPMVDDELVNRRLANLARALQDEPDTPEERPSKRE